MWNIVGYGGPGIQILRINQIDSEGIQKLILMFVIRCRRYNTVAILRLILTLRRIYFLTLGLLVTNTVYNAGYRLI